MFHCSFPPHRVGILLILICPRVLNCSELPMYHTDFREYADYIFLFHRVFIISSSSFYKIFHVVRDWLSGNFCAVYILQVRLAFLFLYAKYVKPHKRSTCRIHLYVYAKRFFVTLVSISQIIQYSLNHDKFCQQRSSMNVIVPGWIVDSVRVT